VSRLVREWLIRLGLFHLTTHEDRLEIDRIIEERTGVDCDTAIAQGLISETEFRKIVDYVLRRKRRKSRRALETLVI